MYECFHEQMVQRCKRVSDMPRIDAVSAFCEDADLNRTDSLYLKRREEVMRMGGLDHLSFGYFHIAYSEGWEWWTPYIGIEFLGLFPGKYGYKDEIRVSRAVGRTKIAYGRGIPFKYLTLL